MLVNAKATSGVSAVITPSWMQLRGWIVAAVGPASSAESFLRGGGSARSSDHRIRRRVDINIHRCGCEREDGEAHPRWTLTSDRRIGKPDRQRCRHRPRYFDIPV